MFKPTFLNICISIFLSYLTFFALTLIINHDYKVLKFENIKNGQDLFLYLWIVLFFPILDIILFAAPIYFSFKLKKIFTFILAIIAIYMIEYFIYVYFTSQKLRDVDGFQKGIIGLIVFFVSFYRSILSKG